MSNLKSVKRERQKKLFNFFQAIIEADEKGIEASGATGIAITLYSFFTPDQEVIFDRPFLFFLVDNDRDLPIFAGVVENPTK